MPLQNQIGHGMAAGLPGDPASANTFSTIVRQALGPCFPGRFLWLSADGKTFSSLGTGAPDAFCKRDQTQPTDQNAVVRGSPVTGVVNGDWYAVAKTTASVKQKVFASPLDGTISTGLAGADVPGHVETEFTVMHITDTGAAGSLIVISKY